jgi:integrase
MAVYQDKDKNGKVIKTKDGRSWYFRLYKDGKQYQSKKYKKKEEAEDEEALFLLKRDNPLYKPFSVIARGYFEELKKSKKESTFYTYEKDYNKHIKSYFEKYNNISSIGISIIRDWSEEMEKKKLSVAFLNKIRNILKGIFDYAIRNFNLENNPVVTYGTFKTKNDKIITDEEKLRYITYNEFNQFITFVDDDLWNTFFTFAYYTGCRKGEMQALIWKDIDLDNNIISITKTLYEVKNGLKSINSTKNNQNRKIKMSKTLSECMKKYKNKVMTYTDFNEQWFVFGNIKNLSKTSIERYRKKYFDLSGVHEITMHEFRHSHVSLLINEFVKSSKEKNIKIDTTKFFVMMSNRMGHTIPVMQRTYMHLFPTIQDEIVDLLDNL